MKISAKGILLTFIPSVLASLLANILYDVVRWCLKRFRFPPPPPPPPRPREYTRTEIEAATSSFGTPIVSAMGNAYWGSLHGTEVAICPWDNPTQGDGFNRVVIHLSQIQHENVVEFLGYCRDQHGIAIVYKLMHHKSLGEILDDVAEQPPLRARMNWSKRLQIAADVAKGIEYIHNRCHIIPAHGHLRSSNILINKRMRAQVSGLLEAIDHNGNPHEDIEALGIVLLELVTGQNAGTGEIRETSVVDWVRGQMAAGHQQAIMDPVLDPRDRTTVDKITDMAVECTDPIIANRPPISTVLNQIQYSIFQEENFI